jgi:hypothetical protein
LNRVPCERVKVLQQCRYKFLQDFIVSHASVKYSKVRDLPLVLRQSSE